MLHPGRLNLYKRRKCPNVRFKPVWKQAEKQGNRWKKSEKTGNTRQIPEESGKNRKKRQNLWFGTKRPRVRIPALRHENPLRMQYSQGVLLFLYLNCYTPLYTAKRIHDVQIL